VPQLRQFLKSLGKGLNDLLNVCHNTQDPPCFLPRKFGGVFDV
jgi:hypothetical protein